jgi:hypothetical protein
VEPAVEAADQLDAYARAVRMADVLIEDQVERWAVVQALVGRLVEHWPEDAPLVGAGRW